MAFTCRRSDLWWASSSARPVEELVVGQRPSGRGLRRDASRRLLRFVIGVEDGLPGEHGPQDPRVLVGQSHDALLPAQALPQLHQPPADAIGSFARTHDGRLRALDQQGAQVVVAALGDAAQAGLAPCGVLAGHQSEPRAELSGVGELPEVAHAGHDSRSGGRTDTAQRGGLLRALIGAHVGGDALIAPGHLQFDVDPVQMGPLQRQASDGWQLVRGVFDDIGQCAVKGVRASAGRADRIP